MENVSYIALSRQTALQRQLDIVAHNLANVNTPAFKSEQMVFAEYITEPARGETISLVQDIDLARNLTEGPMNPTGNPLDLAISGNAYFVVETPLGDRYTRHGRLQLDAERQIVTSQGYPILSDANQPISIPPGRNDLNVAADGTISDPAGPLGRINLVQFADEQLLRRNANALYNTTQDPEAAPDGEVVTADGNVIQPGITIPADAIDITVNSSGEVLVKLDGQVAPTNVGQFELAIFPNEAGLLAIGDNTFLETPASGSPSAGTPESPGFGRIQQGFLKHRMSTWSRRLQI